MATKLQNCTKYSTLHTAICHNLPGRQCPTAWVQLAFHPPLCQPRTSQILSERIPPEIHPWWRLLAGRFYHTLHHQRQRASSVPETSTRHTACISSSRERIILVTFRLNWRSFTCSPRSQSLSYRLGASSTGGGGGSGDYSRVRLAKILKH